MTARSKVRMTLLATVAALVLVPLASGHAELTPEKSPAGSFKKFVLSVENEQADASTVKVVVRFPESVPTATFTQAPGWTRTVETLLLDTSTTGPDGETIDKRIVTVTWEGGEISPEETGEFGFRFQVPEQPGATIFFPTVQTYSDGTVVRWIGPPGSDEPAPGVRITQATGGGGGTTTVETESVPVETTTVATTVTTAPETTTTAAPVPTSSEDDGGSSLPLILGLLALIAALAGLGYWLYTRNKGGQPPQAGRQAPPDEQLTQRIDPPDRPL
jgi:periplasmic copper chaperone A